jgi:hypothetical protein
MSSLPPIRSIGVDHPSSRSVSFDTSVKPRRESYELSLISMDAGSLSGEAKLYAKLLDSLVVTPRLIVMF